MAVHVIEHEIGVRNYVAFCCWDHFWIWKDVAKTLALLQWHKKLFLFLRLKFGSLIGKRFQMETFKQSNILLWYGLLEKDSACQDRESSKKYALGEVRCIPRRLCAPCSAFAGVSPCCKEPPRQQWSNKSRLSWEGCERCYPRLSPVPCNRKPNPHPSQVREPPTQNQGPSFLAALRFW